MKFFCLKEGVPREGQNITYEYGGYNKSKIYVRGICESCNYALFKCIKPSDVPPGVHVRRNSSDSDDSSNSDDNN